MKKNDCFFREWKLPGMQKVLRSMKLTIFLLLISVISVLANKSYSQARELVLNMKNCTVKEVLHNLESQSDFDFVYSEKFVDVEQNVSIDIKSHKINEVLDELFVGTNVSYKIKDRFILLTTSDEISSQQSVNISGSVLDSFGAPLPGVTVIIKGTTKGTITDVDGTYSLKDLSADAVLVFSFVGMTNQEIPIAGKTSINVVMEEDAIGIEEVVALGYTTQKESKLIGSVAKVTNNELRIPAYSNFTAALQGKASGVYVSDGKIRIRGTNSISLNADPLWVIDGMPGNGSNLNPNDIESVTILKDAAATALYGSSGANGVIVVTTKTMSKDKTQTTIEVNSGFEEFIGTGYPVCNSSQFINIHDISLQNASKYSGEDYIPYDPNKAFDWNRLIPTENRLTRTEAEKINTSIFEEATDIGRYNQAYISSSNALNNGKAFFTVTYRNNDGQVKGISSEKFVGRVGMNYSVTDNLYFIISSINTINKANTSGAKLVLNRPPIMPIYDDNDKTGYWSPAANEITQGDSDFAESSNSSFSSINYLKLNYSLPYIKGLSLGGLIKLEYLGNKSLNWYSEELRKLGDNLISLADESFSQDKSYLYRGEINYKRTIGDHAIDAIFLGESIKGFGNYLFAMGSDLNGSYHILGTPSTMNSMMSEIYQRTSVAFIGRLSYSYKDKFLFEGNIRKDGISKLPKVNRYSIFPSIGLGWIISEEDFFNIPSISLFKIRGSMGKTGNSAIPEFTYASTYAIQSPSGSGYDNYMTSKITNLASIVQWEASDNIDIGFDFGILSNRINGSFAYYDKKISGLLLEVPIPPSTGMDGGTNSIWDNIGNMRNSGLEFDVNAYPIRKEDFAWNISFNFSTNNNKVLALSPSVDIKGEGLYGNHNLTISKKGEKLATYFLPEFAGIDPEKGIPLIWERDAQTYAETGKTVKTGNKIPATSVNEGKNQMILNGKSSSPNFYGGFRNTFTYKNLSLNMMLTFSGGHYLIDQQLYDITNIRNGMYNLHADLLEDSWEKPGDNAIYQEPIYNGGFYYDDEGNATSIRSTGANMTSQYLKRADNIQLKELTIAYDLKSKFPKLKFREMKLYLNINNVAYWSKAGRWQNPEVSIGGNLDGYQRYGDLVTRTYSLGVSIGF